MSALAFDPWTALKCKAWDDAPAKVANPANLAHPYPEQLAKLAALAGVLSPAREIAVQQEVPPSAVVVEPVNVNAEDEAPAPVQWAPPAIPLDEMVEEMAEAMYANRTAAMDVLRGVARQRLSATDDPVVRGLWLGWERHWLVREINRNAPAPRVLRYNRG